MKFAEWVWITKREVLWVLQYRIWCWQQKPDMKWSFWPEKMDGPIRSAGYIFLRIQRLYRIYKFPGCTSRSRMDHSRTLYVLWQFYKWLYEDSAFWSSGFCQTSLSQIICTSFHKKDIRFFRMSFLLLFSVNSKHQRCLYKQHGNPSCQIGIWQCLNTKIP